MIELRAHCKIGVVGHVAWGGESKKGERSTIPDRLEKIGI